MSNRVEIITRPALGYDQLFLKEIDGITAAEVERQITWSQQGNIVPGDTLSDQMIMETA
ncbi:hypothetical protein [Sphingobium sp.]|uniref:hypothetical protein n=1 Tax=Sphingobium TaxID=165695 RepID=UPI001A1F80BD|nr:hypothetical protein [Sphingobium sp.]MBJ7378601.1 hypothetical protein [Sphingobium sp.]